MKWPLFSLLFSWRFWKEEMTNIHFNNMGSKREKDQFWHKRWSWLPLPFGGSDGSFGNTGCQDQTLFLGVFLWGCFQKRLAFESVDWIKQMALPGVGEPQSIECLGRTKGWSKVEFALCLTLCIKTLIFSALSWELTPLASGSQNYTISFPVSPVCRNHRNLAFIITCEQISRRSISTSIYVHYSGAVSLENTN